MARSATVRTGARAGKPSVAAAPSAAGVLHGPGAMDLDGVTALFGMTQAQIAETAGLARETLQKVERRNAPKTQGRLREMLEILRRVEAWAGGPAQAMAWYRAEPIPAFGDRTAEALVKAGQAGAVRDYLDHVASGGYA
ncbi:antitoxin Xre/MbcA/ParS toxin-binding domain-containing protein [Phenylobacterium sp. SCN 70-31]|uniref:antitoxin Xre/MbcA/ParS toxin-binding domain-containing protein n=1 Tax=Phenylobacterium sp. SCN 70-31 TaxID=1660129 RepID=UPI000AB07C9E|nr:antitoxin Xre/MbcA/ParS toxin-binding domain-containing protein [Phenylobacterium sp. SCN 70-31]